MFNFSPFKGETVGKIIALKAADWVRVLSTFKWVVASPLNFAASIEGSSDFFSTLVLKPSEVTLTR